jgi:succinyl-CoA:acetate CoA-transferase
MDNPAGTGRVETGLPEATPVSAARHIASDATVAVSGFGSVGYPKEVPLALASSDRDLSLTVISGGSVGEEIDTALVEAGAIERRFPYQATRAARDAINSGSIAFHDRHISGLGDEVAFGHLHEPDTAVVEAVAVGKDWLVPSTSIGHTPTYVAKASELIVEVNAALPRELERFHDVYRPSAPPRRDPIPIREPSDQVGLSRIEFDPEKLTSVVRTDQRGSPYSFRTPTADDRGIAANFREFMSAELSRNPLFEEALCLQFGVGSLGNALMSEIAGIPTDDRSVVYFGEVIQDGLLDLLAAGDLEVASATALALSEQGQDQLFDDVDRFAENVILRPADISNAPELVNRFGILAVNSALEVDIYGHVNSTHVGGNCLINGIGGSNDFTRHAAVSVIALPSTAADGDISRIRPMVPHVDHTEHDVAAVITEQGVADLRGLAPRERATEIIENCAHPDFQSDLREYYSRVADDGGHMPHDPTTAFDRFGG